MLILDQSWKHLLPRHVAPAPPSGVTEAQTVDSQFSGLDVLGRALYGVAVLCGKLGDELQQRGALVVHGLSVAAQHGLVLGRQHVDPGLQLGQTVPDVVHE